VYALYRRFFQYAIRGTVTAGHTYFGIDLPDGISGVGLSAQEDGSSAKTGQTCRPEVVPQKMASVNIVFILCHCFNPLKILFLTKPEAGRTSLKLHSPGKLCR
jgi:hypothetical protein